MTPIFLDANVPMYAAGRPHPLKEPCRRVMRAIDRNPTAFVTNVEVLQEILHRYLAVRRWDQGRAVFLRVVVAMEGRIEPITQEDVELAADIADRHPTLDARDLLHTAVMSRLRIARIVSTDTGCDRIDGIERLDPMRFEEWAPSITDPV